MPAERTKGRFAKKAIQNDAIADARAVAVNMAPVSIPVLPRMLGLTARIYAIVINVVIPAINSVFTLVPRSLSLNNFSIEHPLWIYKIFIKHYNNSIEEVICLYKFYKKKPQYLVMIYVDKTINREFFKKTLR